MKKFISMVMAAAMVVSLVPATAFAKGDVTATAKVVDDWEKTKNFNGIVDDAEEEVPELQLTITNADYTKTDAGKAPEMDVTVTLDNADFKLPTGMYLEDIVGIRLDKNTGTVSEELQKALDDAKKAEEAAQTAYDTAVKNAQVPQDIQAAKDAADTAVAALTKVNDKAVAAVKVAEKNLADAKAAEQTAKNDYYTAVADDDDTNDEAAKTAWDNAKTAVTAAETALSEAKAAAATAADELAAAKADQKKAQDAFDKAAAETAAEELKALNEAKAATKAAQKAVDNAKANGNISFKDVKLTDDNELEFTIVGEMHKDDIVFVDLYSVMDKTSEGRKATVSVDSKMVSADDLVYVSILGQGITASVKKQASIAEEEVEELAKDLVIKSNVGDFVKGQKFELKLSKGFEFTKNTDSSDATYSFSDRDDNKITLTYNGNGTDEIKVKADDIQIEAVSAKSGATATLTVKAVKDSEIKGTFTASTTVEVAKVVDYKVVLSVDEDEDVPVIYSGVDADNTGITDDSDHWSLEVTAEETFPGAWSMRKGFSFELPEGVYVTDVEVTDAENFYQKGVEAKDQKGAWNEAFFNAYQDGDHLNFEFEKRVFDDVNTELAEEAATVTFKLQLVADPTFEGDVVLKLTGDLVDAQEVTIAKFVKPYTVKAEQNDMKIDYRYTEIPTAITITEAEAGLWAKDAEFTFKIDKGDYIEFEDDATFEIDKDSELEIKDTTEKGTLSFKVKAESDEAATVTIKDMQLFMQRNIPAGPYDLTISSSLETAFLAQGLFAPDEANCTLKNHDDDKECYVDDIDDYSDVVKAAFVNVITGGRDKDDASFTTKVVVPVGESYIISGENQVALDVPAYVSAAGYTMLPVRAVAVALGIDTQNVLWNQPTRTVTILYGQRIITMTAGQKVVYVNGSAIPASASVEITNGRTFLPMRDLATALGVTDITWDAATKTATLNGSK